MLAAAAAALDVVGTTEELALDAIWMYDEGVAELAALELAGTCDDDQELLSTALVYAAAAVVLATSLVEELREEAALTEELVL